VDDGHTSQYSKMSLRIWGMKTACPFEGADARARLFIIGVAAARACSRGIVVVESVESVGFSKLVQSHNIT